MSDVRRHVPTVALTWDDEEPARHGRTVEGTLVFADISGFTALTERLAQRGRIGAEEIVETLNRVFGAMLHTAGRRGGDLLKFGGDALFFLFRGEGHAVRACDAALEMRSALREAAAERTQVGRLRLSMSVGIHSGAVPLVLAGEPTRELLVLGSAAGQTIEAEQAAGPGEIVVTAATAALLPRAAIRRRADGRLLLRRRRTEPPDGPLAVDRPHGRSDVDHVHRERVLGLFPPPLGRHLDPGPPEPEHRQATIAFVRFSGTDALLAADLDQTDLDRADLDHAHLDQTAAAVHETLRTAMACLAEEGVTLLAVDLDRDGGKLFLASGVPQATEDDEGRMLRALRRLFDAGPPLRLQAGVNRGHVFAAEVGTDARAAFSAMGDTTNTAARIAAKAPPGSIYAHPDVLEHAHTRFAATPAGPFTLKGKARPLLVYDVGEELGTREARDGRLPLLGRDDEVASLRYLVARALSGAGGVVTVTGDTGMGTSRVARDVASSFADVRVVALRGEPYGAASPYRVLRDPLRRLLGLERADPVAMGRQLVAVLATVAPDLVPMAALLADLAHVDVPASPEVEAIDPQFRPDRAADVLIRLMDAALPGRLIVLVDEAHWADMASAHLLDRLAAATTGRPWMLVVTRRAVPGGFSPATGPQVALGPLPPSVIQRLVIEATEGAPLRPHEIAAVVSRADGNPLLAEELTRIVRGMGSLDALPESLQAAASAQIDLLDPQPRRVLRHAAVLGRSFRRVVLRETLSDAALDVATMAALADLLEPDGPERLRFANSLVRDAAYEGLAYRVRSRLHRDAGLAVERLSSDLESDAATLSLHFSRAGDDERTWRYARQAGAVARRAYANADAAAQYALALDAGRRLGVPDRDLAEVWAVVGELRELAGLLPESVDAYRRAVRLSGGDPVVSAGFLARQARVLERSGAYVRALRALTRARRQLDAVAPDATAPHAMDPAAMNPAAVDPAAVSRIRVRLDTLTALVRLGQEQPAEARRWALRAAAGARSTDDPETLVQALMAVDHAELMLGLPVSGRHTREALEICIAHGFRPRESIARTNLGNFAFFAGRWDEAVEWYRSSRVVALAAGNDFGAAEVDLSLGDILVSRGQVDEAEPLLRDAVRVLRASAMDFEAAYGAVQLARAELVRGRLAEADALVADCVAEFLALGHRVTALEASLVQAEIANAAAEPLRALEIVATAEATARGDGAPLRARACLQRATATLALDRLDDCRDELFAGLAAAREQDLPYEEALLLQVRSRLHERAGDTVSAAADDDAAAALLTRLGARG